jgi:predicted secreted protein
MGTKQAAFHSHFYLGTRQVESMTVTGAAAGAGDLTVTVTATGIAGVVVTVDVLNLDTPDTVATKVRTHMNALATITNFAVVGGTGATFDLTMLLPAANAAGAAMQFVFAAGATGVTMGATTDTTAGAAFVEVAAVKSIVGPGLKLDTVDVTTHDSTLAWEESVGTILREGEVKLELVYDPADDTHDGTAVGGLAYCLKNKLLKHFKVTFPDATAWTFPGYVAAFESSAPHDKDLTATVSIRIAGAPVIA